MFGTDSGLVHSVHCLCVFAGGNFHLLVEPGREGFVGVFVPEYFLMAQSDDIVAADSGLVHSVHCLTPPDVVCFANGSQLGTSRWQQTNRGNVRFGRHIGDQESIGSVHGRTDSERGSRAEVIRYGGRKYGFP